MQSVPHPLSKKILILMIVFMVGMSTFSNSADAALGDRNLSRGSRGPEVSELQKRLSMLGYVVGRIDGIYGAQTEARVRLFQKEHGLRVDGIAGTRTIRELKRLTGESVTGGGTAIGYKNSDINLLAHLVSAEAKGEPYRGQIAVAAVVLNRVKSSSFPNTIPGVIYQPGAFSPVSDGTLWSEPVSSAYDAVYEALNGTDPAYGALFFFNPAKTSNRYIWSRPQIIQIGKHIFCR
ncbi:spore cortex-lytic enzyme [Dehalobacter sp. DCM]|uniref:spore cortex-lytic enzyme n=1 Tax=Dehalobacter sp. DCM TaxID=2907827 RepID=UPI003081D283|nr:spore cortex-lytic enzyme [Dehalobacter sp. DCM]